MRFRWGWLAVSRSASGRETASQLLTRPRPLITYSYGERRSHALDTNARLRKTGRPAPAGRDGAVVEPGPNQTAGLSEADRPHQRRGGDRGHQDQADRRG